MLPFVEQDFTGLLRHCVPRNDVRGGDGRLALKGGARSVAGMTIGQGCNQGEASPFVEQNFTGSFASAQDDALGFALVFGLSSIFTIFGSVI